MQLSSDAQIPDGLLAAMTLLKEKPRLGFRTSENTPYPAFTPTQSTTALRDSWSVASGTGRVSLSCDFGVCAPVGPGGFGFENADALTWGLPFCTVQPEVCVVGLGAVTVGVVGYEGYQLYKHISSNIAQNRQFDEAVRQIESHCGQKLSKGDRRRLHDEITGQGFSLPDIVNIGVGMFCPGK
jgi:hypothetical protein